MHRTLLSSIDIVYVQCCLLLKRRLGWSCLSPGGRPFSEYTVSVDDLVAHNVGVCTIRSNAFPGLSPDSIRWHSYIFGDHIRLGSGTERPHTTAPRRCLWPAPTLGGWHCPVAHLFDIDVLF